MANTIKSRSIISFLYDAKSYQYLGMESVRIKNPEYKNITENSPEPAD
jgi:hypothetical protein